LIGIVGMLAKAGFDYLAEAGEDAAREAVKKATGINLDEKSELTESDLQKIKSRENAITEQLNIILADKHNARNMAIELSKSDSFLLKNTGSMIGIFTIITSFVLFVFILSGNLDTNNPNVSLILGFAGGYITQILSFYYGATKNK